MSDTHERIATDAIRILFMLAFESRSDTPPTPLAIHRAADSLAARLETLGLSE